MTLQEALSRYHQHFDPQAQVSHLEAIGAGWETDIYRYSLHAGGASVQRVLRQLAGQGAAEKAQREFTVMRYLHAQGYPVPAVHHMEGGHEWLGGPFLIMDYIPGQPLSSALATQPPLMERFTQMMHRLYQLPPPPLAPLSMEKLLQEGYRLAAALPDIRPALDWLAARLPHLQPEGFALTHGDFHPANVLLTPAAELFVIDWSWAQVSDPRLDVAWARIVTIQQPQLSGAIVAGVAAAGTNLDQFPIFEAVAALRRLLDMLLSLQQGAEAQGMKPAALQQMQQQAAHFRQVYALLQAHTGLRLPSIEGALASLG